MAAFDDFELDEGTLEVAAIPMRVMAHVLVKNSVTLPAATAPVSSNPTPIVGRIDELARLHAAWQRAQNGNLRSPGLVIPAYRDPVK